MARLLVSVRTAVEAADAVRGGADIIDVKEPNDGSLGRPGDAVVSAVVGVARGRSVSVALGELSDWADGSGNGLPPLRGIRFAKVGLAGCASRSEWPRTWHHLQRRIANTSEDCTRLIAVAYADHERASAPCVEEVLALVGDARCRVLLLDTWGKDGRGLLERMEPDELAALSVRCADRGLELALAGSLAAVGIARLRSVAPAIVAVRGAACRDGKRRDSVREASVRRLARLVHALDTIDSMPSAAPAGS